MKRPTSIGFCVAVLFSASAFAVQGRHSGIVKLFSGPRAIETCALMADGVLSCWGYVRKSPEPVPIPGAVVTQASMGFIFGCAATADQRVYCWGGDDAFGQLGSTDKHSEPRAIQYRGADFVGLTTVSAGGEHACALRSDGTAWCWGSNRYGQLGNFNVAIGGMSISPVQVFVHDPTGRPPNPPLTNLKRISAGSSHTCVLFNDNTGACWGLDGDGQLGNTKASSYPAPQIYFDSPQTIMVQAASGFEPLVMSYGEISLGGRHSCALVDDDIASVGCWGYNQTGQLGIGTETSESSAFSAQDEVGKIKNAFEVSGGLNFTCAILGDTTVRCWGTNAQNEMGNPTVPVSANQLVGGTVLSAGNTPLNFAVQIATGASHACVLRTNNEVLCWGDNANSQLGFPGAYGISSPIPQVVKIDSPIFTDNFDGN